MNRIKILLLIGICITGSLWSDPLQATQVKDEIWGVKWGSDVTALGNAGKTATKGPVDYYVQRDAVYVIDEFEFSNVVYAYYQNSLFAVFVHIDNIEVFSQVKSYIQSKYGIPKMVFSQQSRFPNVYRWKDKPIKIKMKSNANTGKMKLVFYYMPISQQLNESQQEAYQEENFKLLPINKDSRHKRIPLLTF